MSERQIDRRRVLTFGAATALGLWSAPAPKAQQPDLKETDGRFQFTVNIPGLPAASKNIREIAIDELNIDARATTTGRDNEFWRVNPRRVHVGSAKFTSAVTLGASKELQTWWQEAAKGKAIRKNIAVTLFNPDDKTQRSWLLMECFPTQWAAVNFDTSSTVQTETLTVKIGRIEFST